MSTIKGLLHFDRLSLLWGDSSVCGTGKGLTVSFCIREDSLKVLKTGFYFPSSLQLNVMKLGDLAEIRKLLQISITIKGNRCTTLLNSHIFMCPEVSGLMLFTSITTTLLIVPSTDDGYFAKCKTCFIFTLITEHLNHICHMKLPVLRQARCICWLVRCCTALMKRDLRSP